MGAGRRRRLIPDAEAPIDETLGRNRLLEAEAPIDETPDEADGDDLTDLSAWGLDGDGEDTDAEPPIDETPEEITPEAEATDRRNSG